MAQPVSGDWTDEGSLSYIAYTPQPVTVGSGISFTASNKLSIARDEQNAT